MRLQVLVFFLAITSTAYSFDKLILNNGERKVKVKLGYQVRIELLNNNKQNASSKSIYGIVREFSNDSINIEISQKCIAVDTIPTKEYSRKLKKEGWVMVRHPNGSYASCDVIIEKYGEGINRIIAYSDIHSLEIRNTIPPKDFAYFLSSVGVSAIGAAPFTGIRSDRYHWPSFFSFIVGGFGTILTGLIIDANSDDYAYEFQNYQREFK